jgi:hypothetical protein
MNEDLISSLTAFWSTVTAYWPTLPIGSEFWSAIAGAIVGGVIAYLVQVKALREGRRAREADQSRVRLALANSLLFKVLQIHSNVSGIRDHFEKCFARAASGPAAQPWEIVLPLANFPDRVNFSSDEMGMLLSLKDDDTFNLVLSMDVKHNSLIDTIKVLSVERRALTERLTPEDVQDTMLSGKLNAEQERALWPRMIEVNGLIESARAMANDDFDQSRDALNRVHEVLRDKLGIPYSLQLRSDRPDVAGGTPIG